MGVKGCYFFYKVLNMDSDAERFMDMNIVPKDQDQTRNVLWMMIFRIFMGKTCFFF